MKLAQKLAIGFIRSRINLTALISSRKAAALAFDVFCTPVQRSIPKLPPVFEQSEKLSFKINSILVKGNRWNYPKGKKVLIIHGFESSSRNFDRYIVPLIKNGMEIIAFDAPAHGQSEGKSVNLPLYTKMLVEIVKQFGPFYGYISHSFGGLALAHMLEQVEHGPVTKAVLIAPATETTSAIDSFFKFLQLDHRIRPAFDALIIQKGGVAASHYSVKRAMQQINAQVLWIHDEQDEVTPLEDAMKVQEAQHPHVRFIITKGLGHKRIYKDNEVVKKVVAFLGSGDSIMKELKDNIKD